MVDETSKDANCTVFYIEIGILKTIKEHQQVLEARNKRIKLRVKVFQHCAPNSIVIISGGCHKKFMQ